jgi:hypothetical protein
MSNSLPTTSSRSNAAEPRQFLQSPFGVQSGAGVAYAFELSWRISTIARRFTLRCSAEGLRL